MVNNEKFAERLKKVMEYYHVSAASFADEINVQRSSISHLLSGRNKPSLDFVLKVLERYKEVDLYWLLNGKGSFPLKKEKQPPTPHFAPKTDTSTPLENKGLSDKEIERIIIFYKDGSFENYTP